MSPTAKRLAALAAVATMGVAAPVAGASAATPPLPFAGLPFAGTGLPGGGFPGGGFPGAGLPGGGLPAFDAVPLTFVGPSIGQIAAVIGPTVITTAPSNFVNTNLQTTAGSAVTGGQGAG
jgi:hypothetical protein